MDNKINIKEIRCKCGLPMKRIHWSENTGTGTEWGCDECNHTKSGRALDLKQRVRCSCGVGIDTYDDHYACDRCGLIMELESVEMKYWAQTHAARFSSLISLLTSYYMHLNMLPKQNRNLVDYIKYWVHDKYDKTINNFINTTNCNGTFKTFLKEHALKLKLIPLPSELITTFKKNLEVYYDPT